MGKRDYWKGGNMLYPLPAVMVSCVGADEKPNIITIAWAGTVCTNPPYVSISVRPQRHSYSLIKDSGEFVVNLVTKDLVAAADWCGVKSGRDFDKFKETGLTPVPSKNVKAPTIGESPLALECRVDRVLELGSHHMFLAEVLGVSVDTDYMNSHNKFELNSTGLVTYSHGEYFILGKKVGSFGYSVRKSNKRK